MKPTLRDQVFAMNPMGTHRSSDVLSLVSKVPKAFAIGPEPLEIRQLVL